MGGGGGMTPSAARLLLALLLLAGLWSPLEAQDRDGLDRAERQRLALAAERSFVQMVRLWKDQRFEELYELGTLASQVDLSPEAFARQMQHASRTLQCCWAMVRDLSSRLQTPERVYVRARLGFKNKAFLIVQGEHRVVARGFDETETLTFVLQREEQGWRIDLFKVLALSGVSLELPGVLTFFGHPR